MQHTLAIDAMGGDHAPQAIIDGMALFHDRFPGVNFLVYGKDSMVSPLMKGYPSLLRKSEFIPTEEVVTAEVKASDALRKLQNSSMGLALKAVKENHACAVLSAGNTGAYMALSKYILRMLPGIERPAIASCIPTAVGKSVMLDLGGNLTASANNLVEYALMGDIFARCVFGIQNPSIGLLNVGKESSKGNDVLKEAYRLLENMSFLRFAGFVEGDDVTAGNVSVVVTDGFSGNIALKSSEGVFHLLSSALKEVFNKTIYGKIAFLLVGKTLRKTFKRFDPCTHNGALWLGLNGIAVKSHGNTNAVGFSNAMEVAYEMVRAKALHAICNALEHVSPLLHKDTIKVPTESA